MAGWEHQWLVRDKTELLVPLRSGTETDLLSQSMDVERCLYVCGQRVRLRWTVAALSRFARDCAEHVSEMWGRLRPLAVYNPPAIHAAGRLSTAAPGDLAHVALHASRCARWAQWQSQRATGLVLDALLGAYFAAEAVAAAADFSAEDPGAAANFAILAVGSDPSEIETEVAWQRAHLIDALLLEESAG